MNALWPLGEATVRDIQVALAPTRPRAYTTIMTILDRLAQKGVVLRRKGGRAWVYSANISEAEARSRAIAQLVDGFFDGSAEALAAYLELREATPHGQRQFKPQRPRPSIVRNTAQAPNIAEAVPPAQVKVRSDLDTELL
jgi:predicted transcriptional regulator